MSLGLPAHLARRANARALAAASRVAAMVCLAAAAASILLPGLFYDAGIPWWALLALAPMAALLLALQRSRTAALTVAYLVVGFGSTFAYTFALLAQTSTYRNTDLFVVAMPVVALTLVGGAGTGAFAGILWATTGFALGEAAVCFAALAAQREFRFDGITLGAYLFLAGVLAFDGLTHNARRDAQALILRTMRAEQAAAIRHSVAEEAVRELHDGILSQLGVLACAVPGELSPELRRRLDNDLATFSSDPQLQPTVSATANVDPDAAWRATDLFDVVEQARDSGLAVDVTGDRAAIGRLTVESAAALSLAVRQCLVNVLRHSGVLTAEVTISAGDDDVCVMVVDAGSGFDASAVGAERLGLRHSVHGRIERMGGEVNVFSSPDAGTSVVMRLPAEGVVSSAPDPERRPL